MLHFLLGLLILAELYTQSFYALLGGLYPMLLLIGLWFCVRLWSSFKGDKTWLRSVQDYAAELACLGAFTAAIATNIAFRRGQTGDLHMKVTLRVLFGLFIICSYSRSPFNAARMFALSVVIVLGAYAWISIPTLLANPLLPRNMIIYDEAYRISYNSAYETALLMGVGDYSVYTSRAIVFPCLLAVAAATKGIGRYILMALCTGIAVSVFLSGFAGAFMTLILSTLVFAVAAAWKRKWTHQSVMRTLVICFTICGIMAAMAVLEPQFEGLEFSMEKAKRLFSGVLGSGFEAGDETGRFELLMASLGTFLNNPIIGIGPVTGDFTDELMTKVGAHSSLFDQLAEYGLLGFGSYLVLLGLLARRIWRGVKRNSDSLPTRGVAVTFVAFVLTGLYNMTVMVPEIPILVFGFIVASTFSQRMVADCVQQPHDRSPLCRDLIGRGF